MAPALTELPDGSGFELLTHDPDSKSPPSLYRKQLSTLNGVGHRVNTQFDAKMESITGYEMCDNVTGRMSTWTRYDGQGRSPHDWKKNRKRIEFMARLQRSAHLE